MITEKYETIGRAIYGLGRINVVLETMAEWMQPRSNLDENSNHDHLGRVAAAKSFFARRPELREFEVPFEEVLNAFSVLQSQCRDPEQCLEHAADLSKQVTTLQGQLALLMDGVGFTAIPSHFLPDHPVGP